MRPTFVIAISVVLVANAWTLVAATQGRGEAPGGVLELTERELRIPPAIGEGTAVFLEPEWDTPHAASERRGLAAWLDVEKLRELGFEARLPDCEPGHCDASEASRPVLVVLEVAEQPAGERDTRLVAVDAGLDARLLRERYPDPTRHALARGLVRCYVQERAAPGGAPLEVPRLRGTLETLLPPRVFVPLPHARTLADLRERGTSEDQLASEGPRYAVTLSWSLRFEPRIDRVRRLDAARARD